uniref:hypothetical protein n=1 Tax=Candidatus Electronema sp. TaxID=2698783 RepID=UPI004056E861
MRNDRRIKAKSFSLIQAAPFGAAAKDFLPLHMQEACCAARHAENFRAAHCWQFICKRYYEQLPFR